MSEERHQVVDGHLASPKGDRTNATPHLLEAHGEFLFGEAMDRSRTEVKLLKVGERREMDVVLCEMFCVGEVGVVVEDSNVGRRSVIPRSDLLAPFGKAGIRKPLLLEEVLLAAVQPL